MKRYSVECVAKNAPEIKVIINSNGPVQRITLCEKKQKEMGLN
jgi:hypothetical protein